MSSLPAPVRDFVTGSALVVLVLVVVRLVEPRAVGPDAWVLLPLGAGLFMVRQGVRRVVLRQVESTEEPGRDRSWVDDPLRVVALGLVAVLALSALAFW